MSARQMLIISAVSIIACTAWSAGSAFADYVYYDCNGFPYDPYYSSDPCYNDYVYDYPYWGYSPLPFLGFGFNLNHHGRFHRFRDFDRPHGGRAFHRGSAGAGSRFGGFHAGGGSMHGVRR